VSWARVLDTQFVPNSSAGCGCIPSGLRDDRNFLTEIFFSFRFFAMWLISKK